jgi:ABC-2 type transport system ATP-binding protein
VFLDEPTAGLDPRSRRELLGEIARMKHDGHTVLLTTHHLDEAEALCDRVAIISRGRIVATGAPRELTERSSAHPIVSVWTARPIPRGVFADLPGVEQLGVSESSARFATTNVHRAVAGLLARLEAEGIDVTELRVQKQNLEEIFLELTNQNP